MTTADGVRAVVGLGGQGRSRNIPRGLMDIYERLRPGDIGDVEAAQELKMLVRVQKPQTAAS